MTTLTGSEKQIAWAEKIRTEAIEALENLEPTHNVPDAKVYAKIILWHINKEESAKWFIDNKDGFDKASRAYTTAMKISPKAVNALVNSLGDAEKHQAVIAKVNETFKI